MSLANGLSTSLNYSKNQLLALLILAMVSFVSFAFISALILTTDWFQIGKGVRQGCILSPCLFNLYAENIIRNAGLKEAQPGIKISGRNINNLTYADDTTLMAEVKKN